MGISTFGTVIPVVQPNLGFPGNYSRTNSDNIIAARQVSPATANPILFGAGVILIPNAAGGYWQSAADFLATASNAQYLQGQFAGVAVRNVQTDIYFTSLLQNTPSSPTVVSTTASASSGATSLTVGSGTGIVVGMAVEAAGIQANTLVTSVSGTTIGISLETTAALSSTTILFTGTTSFPLGSYTQGLEGEVLERGSITVVIANAGSGYPKAGSPVYIRTVANASISGSAVGDFEAQADLATSSITIGTTIGSTSLTTSAGTSLAVGQYVTSPYLAANTFLTAGSSTSWTMSQPAIATVASGGAMNAYNTAQIGSATDPWIVFRTGFIDVNNVAEITIKTRHQA